MTPEEPTAPSRRRRLASSPLLILGAVLLVVVGGVSAYAIHAALTAGEASPAEAYLSDVQEIAIRDREMWWDNDDFERAGESFNWYDRSTWDEALSVSSEILRVNEDLRARVVALSPPPEFVDANARLADVYAAGIEYWAVLVRGAEMDMEMREIRRDEERIGRDLARANRLFNRALRDAASEAGVRLPPDILIAYPTEYKRGPVSGSRTY